MQIIETKIKQSGFRNWVALSVFLGYKKADRSSLKQRIKRNVTFLNKVLKPLNLKVCFCEIENSET